MTADGYVDPTTAGQRVASGRQAPPVESRPANTPLRERESAEVEATDAEPTETEAKLCASRHAFAAIERAQEIAGWSVIEKRTVDLRDAYWDTPDRRLGRAGCTLRVREMDGAPQGELTYKGPPAAPVAGAGSTGSRRRLEIIVYAPAGSTPADWERLPEARPVLAAVDAMGAAEGLRPDVVLRNPRREMVLRHDGDEAVLSLDEVAIEGRPYRRHYVEIELRRGSRAAMDALVDVAARLFGLRPARRGKVQAARDWLTRHG